MNDRELLEPVEVVGYLNTATDEVVKYGPTLMDWDDEQEPVEPLMTVAQHKRLMAAKDGDAVKVPRELLDRFPEINMANFGADEVELLNDWGIEVYLLGGDQPAQPTKDPLEWSRKHGIEEF